MSIQPDARDRADPDDFKGYLDFDGKEGQGLYSYWNLDTIEHTFAIFRNFKTADGKVAHAPITIPNQDQADQLYRKLKSIIVDACKNQKFRGGAFAEKVKETSALNDIIQFIFWSPVMTKEHRYFFRQSILAIFTQTVSRLKDTVMLGRDGFDDEYLKDYDDTLNEIKEFFQKEKDNPTPIPTDISVKWLEEFGENFTRDYKLALDLNEKGEDGAPFATAVPIRDENGLTIKGWDVDIRELYPVRFDPRKRASYLSTNNSINMGAPSGFDGNKLGWQTTSKPRAPSFISKPVKFGPKFPDVNNTPSLHPPSPEVENGIGWQSVLGDGPEDCETYNKGGKQNRFGGKENLRKMFGK